MPSSPTLYDQLVLSLREKDAIFTFNWDPFLVDALARHSYRITLPHIFHLHGNVRMSFCQSCGYSVVKTKQCPNCNGNSVPSKLLYPVDQKNYSDDPFIKSQWDMAHDFIQRALIITIFGYSAPRTDQEAMAIFTKAWKGTDRFRPIEHLEIINTEDANNLSTQWHEFSHHYHYRIHSNISKSFLARYPRRSCEARFNMGFYGASVKDLPWADDIYGLYDGAQELQQYE